MLNLTYCCPKCKGPLTGSELEYSCEKCAATYPIIAGIADFRVYADPYISLEADRQKGLKLAEQAANLTFAQLVDLYYAITPEVPVDLAQYYLNHHIAGTTRGAALLRRFSNYRLSLPQSGDVLADLGCGTGGFLATAARQTDSTVVGIDIAFRWLIVARKRLEELNITNVHLICACADYLPFPRKSFDHIVAENLIEHVADQDGLFSEIARVRKMDGTVLARTVNRFALGPEPHVGVWGVGYLPRRLMNKYVQMVKHIPYEHIHLQSAIDLNKSIEKAQQLDLHVGPPLLSEDDYRHHPPQRQHLFRIYNKLANELPLTRALMTGIGPYLDIVSEPHRRSRRSAPAVERVSQPV